MKKLFNLFALISGLLLFTGCPVKRALPPDMDLTSDEYIDYRLRSFQKEDNEYLKQKYNSCYEKLLNKYSDLTNGTPTIEELYVKEHYLCTKVYSLENGEQLSVKEEIVFNSSTIKELEIQLHKSDNQLKNADYLYFYDYGEVSNIEMVFGDNGNPKSFISTGFTRGKAGSIVTETYNDDGQTIASTEKYIYESGESFYSEYIYLIPEEINSKILVYSRNEAPSCIDDDEVIHFITEYYYKEQNSGYLYKYAETKEYKDKTSCTQVFDYEYLTDSATYMEYGKVRSDDVYCTKITEYNYNAQKELLTTTTKNMEYDDNHNFATEKIITKDSSDNFVSKAIRKTEYVLSENKKDYRLSKLTITHYNKDDSVKYYIIIIYTEDENGNLPTYYYDSRKES